MRLHRAANGLGLSSEDYLPAPKALPTRVQRTPVVLGTLKNRRVQLWLLQLVEVLDDPGELPCERAVILRRLTFVNCGQLA